MACILLSEKSEERCTVLQGMHEIDKVGITPDTACGLPGHERTVVAGDSW